MTLPLPFWLVMSVIGVAVVVVALSAFSVPPFDNLQTFLAVTSLSVVVYLVFGVFGGFFVGMVVAHRLLANRQFTPFEREVLQSLAELRERLDALEMREKPKAP